MDRKVIEEIHNKYWSVKVEMFYIIRAMITAIVEDMSDEQRTIKYWYDTGKAPDFTTEPDEIEYLSESEMYDYIYENWSNDMIADEFMIRFGFIDDKPNIMPF